MTARTIMIVDDDRGFAQSLARLLGAAGYRTCVSHDPAGALFQSRTQKVDCALIDFNLGASLGTELISRLGEEGHSFPKIMITAYGDVRTATQVMKLGAADFFEKPYEPDELLAGIEACLQRARDSADAAGAMREARRMLRQLTERERQIVDAIVAGQSSRQIAEALSVSQRTVEAHRANVLQKLQIANTASLVRLAVLAGLGSPHGA
jgi:RNA polymerase sigma factor (sigma-70 family)